MAFANKHVNAISKEEAQIFHIYYKKSGREAKLNSANPDQTKVYTICHSINTVYTHHHVVKWLLELKDLFCEMR